MSWNPFKSAKKAMGKLGDWSPFTNRGWKNAATATGKMARGAADITGIDAFNYLDADRYMKTNNKSKKEKNKNKAQANWEREYAAQKEFAQHGVRWRAEDARAAGLSPLAALGGQFPSYQAFVGGGYDNSGGSPSWSELASSAGQSIGNIVQNSITAKERAANAADTARYNDLQLRGLELQNNNLYLDNMYKLSRLVRLNELSPPNPPVNAQYSVASPGQVAPQPSTPVVGSPGQPQRQPGAITDWMWAETDNGRIRVPTPDAKQAMEDDLLLEMDWFIRNRINPWFQDAQRKKEERWANRKRRVGGYQP